MNCLHQYYPYDKQDSAVHEMSGHLLIVGAMRWLVVLDRMALFDVADMMQDFSLIVGIFYKFWVDILARSRK